jgi:hypothetical protein
MFPMKRRKALEALSTCKLANSGQMSETVDAHCSCEPLLFLFLRGDASRSMATCHRDLLKTKAETVEPVPNVDRDERKVRTKAASISFAKAFHEAM